MRGTHGTLWSPQTEGQCRLPWPPGRPLGSGARVYCPQERFEGRGRGLCPYETSTKLWRWKERRRSEGVRRQKRITFTINSNLMERVNLNNLTTVVRPLKNESQQDCTISGWTRPSPHFHPSKRTRPYQRTPHLSPSATTRSHHQHFAPAFPVRPLTPTTRGTRTSPQRFPLLRCTRLLRRWVASIPQPDLQDWYKW